MKNNIPPLISQYREQMLDPKNSMTTRYNYMMNLQNIRDYCDACIREYDKKVRR